MKLGKIVLVFSTVTQQFINIYSLIQNIDNFLPHLTVSSDIKEINLCSSKENNDLTVVFKVNIVHMFNLKGVK